MNQFGLQGLLGSHNQAGLRKTGNQTATEGIHLIFLGEDVSLSILETSKTD